MCDVGDEVRQAVALLQPLAREKGLSLRIEEPGSSVKARLDRTLLSRILNNLVDNAIKFTQHGEVVVAVRALEERVEVAVQDTGIGIDERFIPHLFDAFSQESTGMSRLHEGGGVGLAITKHLVALLKGQIAVESRKEEGSTFKVWFPRLPAEQAAAAAREATVSALRKRRSSPIRVLAVDDDPAMLILIKSLLEEIPGIADVDGAQDDETALTLARRHRYDVVLMDINLGGARTGEDVLHELRRTLTYQDVPVVAVTAYAFPGDRERFLEAGFNAYLGKPFTQERLGEVLAQITPDTDSLI